MDFPVDSQARNAYLSKDEWLARALEALARNHGAKPRIDSLVRDIGVTRGSFYWHFKDRSDFVINLVNFWHQQSTLAVSDYLDKLEAPPRQKLQVLMEMVFVNELTRYDSAVRTWATGESKIALQVRRTDKYRLNYVRRLFQDSGFNSEDAAFRASIFVSEASREGELFGRMSKKDRLHKSRKFYELLVGSDTPV